MWIAIFFFFWLLFNFIVINLISFKMTLIFSIFSFFIIINIVFKTSPPLCLAKVFMALVFNTYPRTLERNTNVEDKLSNSYSLLANNKLYCKVFKFLASIGHKKKKYNETDLLERFNFCWSCLQVASADSKFAHCGCVNGVSW